MLLKCSGNRSCLLQKSNWDERNKSVQNLSLPNIQSLSDVILYGTQFTKFWGQTYRPADSWSSRVALICLKSKESLEADANLISIISKPAGVDRRRAVLHLGIKTLVRKAWDSKKCFGVYPQQPNFTVKLLRGNCLNYFESVLLDNRVMCHSVSLFLSNIECLTDSAGSLNTEKLLGSQTSS